MFGALQDGQWAAAVALWVGNEAAECVLHLKTNRKRGKRAGRQEGKQAGRQAGRQTVR